MFQIKYLLFTTISAVIFLLPHKGWSYENNKLKEFLLIDRLTEIVATKVSEQHTEKFREGLLYLYSKGQFTQYILKPTITNYLIAKHRNNPELSIPLLNTLLEYDEDLLNSSAFKEVEMSLIPNQMGGAFIDVDCWGKCMQDIAGSTMKGAGVGSKLGAYFGGPQGAVGGGVVGGTAGAIKGAIDCNDCVRNEYLEERQKEIARRENAARIRQERAHIAERNKYLYERSMQNQQETETESSHSSRDNEDRDYSYQNEMMQERQVYHHETPWVEKPSLVFPEKPDNIYDGTRPWVNK